MSEYQTEHARRVVEQFQSLLDEETRARIGEEQFDELALMVESAITASVLKELEQAADRIEALSHEVRRQAETYMGSAAET
ncbi:MAG TPA: phosphatase [Chromatiales bacterium]|nr:phosphatase [Chromatiales bacterium]